ncbi:MAG: hypothetical protein ACOCVF_02625 [bacterium]
MYENIKKYYKKDSVFFLQNDFYKKLKENNESSHMFNELIIYTLILKENNEFLTPLKFIKELNKIVNFNLKLVKNYYDVLLEIGFIETFDTYLDGVTRKEMKIKEEIYEIKTPSDFLNIIDNNISLNVFLRNSKLSKILNKK